MEKEWTCKMCWNIFKNCAVTKEDICRKERGGMLEYIPLLQSTVRHKESGLLATVMAVYQDSGQTYLDVRYNDDSIDYGTLAKRWEMIHTEEEQDS